MLMLAGADIPKGLAIQDPYDTLSFAPTVLRLMGLDTAGLPGPVIQELVSSR
jgi:hypothetical protein